MLRSWAGLRRGYPRAPPGSHVDDISQIVACPSGRTAVSWAVGAAAILCDGVRELGLRFSTKSTILPRSSGYAATAAKIIQGVGVPIKLGTRGKDLGIETSWANNGAQQSRQAGCGRPAPGPNGSGCWSAQESPASTRSTLGVSNPSRSGGRLATAPLQVQ